MLWTSILDVVRADSRVRGLRRIPLFAGSSRRELRRAADLCRETTAPAGRILVAEGAIASDFFVITGGTAQVSRGGSPLSVLTAGDFFGEISLVAAVPRTATVTAITELELLVIAQRHFPRLLTEQPHRAERIQSQLVRRLADDASRGGGVAE